MFHPSCAGRVKGAKTLNEREIICCEVKNISGKGSASGTEKPAVSILDSKDTEIRYLKELLKQKDLVIETQTIAIKSQADLVDNLRAQIEDLERKKLGKKIQPSRQSRIDRQLGWREDTNVGSVTGASGSLSVADVGKGDPERCIELVTESQQKSGTSKMVLPAADFTTGTSANHDDPGDGDEGDDGFKTVKRRRQRKMAVKANKPVVGELSEGGNCRLKPAVNYDHWHLYRLDPRTTEEDVVDYLKLEFPEVLVDKLKSRNPDVYASFKVSVSGQNRDNIRKPTLWPRGVRINRFFLPRKSLASN